MRANAYLRTSTKEQGAPSPKETLSEFAESINGRISVWLIKKMNSEGNFK